MLIIQTIVNAAVGKVGTLKRYTRATNSMPVVDLKGCFRPSWKGKIYLGGAFCHQSFQNMTLPCLHCCADGLSAFGKITLLGTTTPSILQSVCWLGKSRLGVPTRSETQILDFYFYFGITAPLDSEFKILKIQNFRISRILSQPIWIQYSYFPLYKT